MPVRNWVADLAVAGRLVDAQPLHAGQPRRVVDQRPAPLDHCPPHRGPADAEPSGHLDGAPAASADLHKRPLAGPFGQRRP